MKSRLFKRAFVLVCTATLIGSTASPASADTGDRKIISVAADSVWKTQEKLDAVVKDVREAAPKDGATGVSGVVVDLESNRISLYWKGKLPAEVTGRIERAKADGIDVVVRQAPYTEVELQRESDRITRKPLFNGPRTGQRSMQVSPRPDGTGLDVGLSGLPADVTPQQAKQAVPALDSAIPMTVTAAPAVEFTTRALDVWPYWGGSFLERTVGGRCSSAFGVTGLNGAATYLLSAAHCGEGTWGGAWYDEGSGPRQDIYGSTIPAGRRTDLDVQLIHTPQGADAYVYWGAHINLQNGEVGATNGLPVRGWTRNSIGNAFCLSGSYSGTICDGANIRVTGVGMTITYDPPSNGVQRVTNLVQGTDVVGARGTGINGNGDSGGPVVSVTGDGGVVGRGIISGMALGPDFERPCAGWAAPGRRCSRIVYFADLEVAMASVGVRINTA